MAVEIRLANATADFDVNLRDPQGVEPENIIRKGEDIRADWYITTQGLGWSMIYGEFEVKVYVKGLGADPETTLEVIGNRATLTGAPNTYFGSVTLPTNALPPGEYHAVATLTYYKPVPPNPADTKGPISCFKDLGLLQVADY